MAKSKQRKKRGSLIKVDFEGVEAGGRALPDGRYRFKIDGVELKESDEGNEYLSWTCVVTGGKHKGVKVWDNTSLQPQALFRLKGLLVSLGVDVPDAAMEIDPNDYVGEEFTADVVNEEYRGQDRPKISQYVVAGEDDGESEDEESEEEDEEEEEEEPAKKRGGRKSKKDDEEEEEDEEEEDDEEEEEEEKPAKRRRGRKAKEEDEEEEEESDEEEEEEEEKPSSKRSSKGASSTFKKKDKVKFKEDGKTYKGKVIDVDGSLLTVDVDGDEWQVQAEDCTAI